MDRWINLIQNKVDLVRTKNDLLETLHESNESLQAFLDYVYESHHSTVHLNTLKQHNLSLKNFEFVDYEINIYEFRKILCSIHCEILLIKTIFFPDVGQVCQDVVDKIEKFYTLLDKIRDCFFQISQIDYIQSKIPL